MGEESFMSGTVGRAPRSRARIGLAWALVAACICAILVFSGESFSASSTWGFLSDWVRWLFPDVGSRDLRKVHRLVRKGAHLAEYALLAFLTCRAVWISFEATWQRTVLLPLGVVLAVAAVDETHQAFSASRTGSVWDVALDFGGGVVGLLVILALHRIMRSELAPASPPAP